VAAIIVFTLLAWSVAGTGASLPALVEGLPAMGDYLRRLLPSEGRPWPLDYLPRIVEPLLQTVKVAFAASVIGSALALPFALVGTRTLAPGRAVYNLARGFLNFLRTIPDLVLAGVLAAAFGLGTLPGLLALVLFTFGVVAKLLADTVETVDPGPLEAISAAGGTRLQRAVFATLPQVGPDFVAYALYAFEINVRVAAVLGFVGAGGIGEVLVADLRLARYGRVGMVIVLTFLLVLIIDSVSTWLRRRLV
jgi:phosphonate transport system permease protein